MGAPAPTPDRNDKPHRSFDPELVGRLECVAWVRYYRLEWLRFLRAVVLVTGRGPGALSVSLADQVCSALSDHERRYDGIGRRHRREDRAVGDR